MSSLYRLSDGPVFTAAVFSALLAVVQLHSADQAFLDAALRTESKVVSLSMLALEKSSSASIRSLAADLLAHHGAIGRGLDKALGKSAFDLPATGFAPDASHLEGLAALRTNEFDHVVLAEIVSLVDKRTRLFDAAVRRHGNLAVRALARNVMGVVVQDANRAHTLDALAQL